MRNVILFSLLAFVLAVGGGFSILWFSQAKTTKNSIERAIAKINEKNTYITYDAIETYGFPANVYVAIIRPRFNGRVDELLRTITGGAMPELAGMPEWSEDVALDGRIVVGVNAMSNRYSLGIHGNWSETSKIGDKTFVMQREQANDTSCTLQLARHESIFGDLWNFAAIGPDGKALLRDLRLFDCSSPGNMTTTLDNHEKLNSSGPVRFYITSDPQGDRQQVRVYAKVADMEITPAGDAVIAAYRDVFSPHNPFAVKYSLFGKQNFEMDFSYKGPTDLQAYGNNPPVEVSLGKFTVTSDVYNFNTTFYLNNAMNGANRAARLAYKSEIGFGQPFAALQPDLVRSFIAQVYAEMNSAPATPENPLAGIQPYLQKYSQEDMYAIVAPAIPDFHSLGTLTDAVDVSFQGAPDMSTGVFTLSALDMSATPYGIAASGSATLAPGRMPGGNASLACRNCLAMIDDMAAYEARVQKTVSYFDAAQAAALYIDPKLVEGVKAFLAALTEPPKDEAGKGTFVYNIVSADSGPTVNGRRMDEVMALYSQYIAPAMLPPEPAPAPMPVKKKQ